MTDEQDGAEVEHMSGKFLGKFRGLKIRGHNPETGQPVLEIHGEDSMAAVEATERSVNGFTEAAAMIQTAIDRHGVDDE